MTPAEESLAARCEKTFLSLWSYPAPQKDDGPGGCGREICDVLVVCGDDVVIFSDKVICFSSQLDVEKAWARWFRKAIMESARQVWGAMRWITEYPDRIFLDRACTQRLPVSLPAHPRFHLVVIAHGIAPHVRRKFGDSGTLMLNMSLRGPADHVEPFWIGDVDPSRPFVHVLEDEALDALLDTRDTVTDAIDYFRKREAFLRSPIVIMATGEEQLLAKYLTHVDSQGQHSFNFISKEVPPPQVLFIDQGHWEAFVGSPERARQREEDKISYVWDRLIERFSHHAFHGTQYPLGRGGVAGAEPVLRLMARESRLARRVLAGSLVEMIESTQETHRRVRVGQPTHGGETHYAFLLLPRLAGIPDDEYRRVRCQLLEACCLVAKLQYPKAKDIVGIATESGANRESRSEDGMFFDARNWTPELAAEARRVQQEFKILTTPRTLRSSALEYPGP